MLDSPMPKGYNDIYTTEQAIDAAVPQLKDLRIHIIWDVPIARLQEEGLEQILDKLRETGAAMVVKVEQV